MMYERFIKLTIESKIDSIALLATAVKAICSTVVHDEVKLYHLELCLVEAISNVINHSYHRQPGNFVEISTTVHDNHVLFEITDRGDKAKLPSPPQDLIYDPNDLSTWPESGMGLFLINHIMDELTYSSEEGKNVLIMKKFLNQNSKIEASVN